MLVEHFERVILFRLFVLDEQDATERAGAKRPFTIEVFQPSVVLPRPAHGNNHTTRSVHGRRVRPTRSHGMPRRPLMTQVQHWAKTAQTDHVTLRP